MRFQENLENQIISHLDVKIMVNIINPVRFNLVRQGTLY